MKESRSAPGDWARTFFPGTDTPMARPFRFLGDAPGGRIAAIGADGGLRLPDPTEAALLQALERPRGLEELERRLGKSGWEGEALSTLPDMIKDLEARGFLLRLGDCLDGQKEAPVASVSAGPGLSCIAWPTRDRPDSLGRALGSWADAGAFNGTATPDFLIADDSVQDPTATRAIALAFAASHPGKVYHLDRAFRHRLADALEAKPGREASFALGLEGSPGPGIASYGAARNLALMAAAGRTVAMADDDTVAAFRLRPDACPGIALSADQDPALPTPFADSEALGSWGLPGAESQSSAEGVLCPHRRLLGRLVRDILAEANEKDFRNATAALLSAALSGNSRVAALCFGTWGASGTASVYYLLSMRAAVDAGDQDVYGDGVYAKARESELLFRAPRRTTIGGKGLMGMHIALDARSLLPPFAPWGAYEDGLWAASLGYLHPEQAIAYPAQAIHHVPTGVRRGPARDPSRHHLLLNEILGAVMGLIANRLEAGPCAYETLGRRLASLARGPRSGLRLALSEAAARLIMARIDTLEMALSDYGRMPEAWALDIEATIRALCSKLEAPGFWIPPEFGGMVAGEAKTRLAEHFLRFGELLIAWPGIFESACKVGPGLLKTALL